MRDIEVAAMSLFWAPFPVALIDRPTFLILYDAYLFRARSRVETTS